MPKPAYLELNPVSCNEELKDTEALFTSDYHESTWDQVFFEFQSHGGCVWTTGNGCVCVAGVKSELPILALTLNETHAQVVTHFVDCHITMAVQGLGSGGSSMEAWFRTYSEEAKTINKKMKALRTGEGSSEDEEEEQANKKPRKKNIEDEDDQEQSEDSESFEDDSKESEDS